MVRPVSSRSRCEGKINNCGVIKPRYSVKKVDLEQFEARYLPAQDFGVLIRLHHRGRHKPRESKGIGVGGKLLAFVY